MQKYIRTKCTKCGITMQFSEDYLDSPEMCEQCEHEYWEEEQKKLAKGEQNG